MLRRDDQRRFAPEFNQFGDRSRVPGLELLRYGILGDFLRVHYPSDFRMGAR
jgi:hypothetical protein